MNFAEDARKLRKERIARQSRQMQASQPGTKQIIPAEKSTFFQKGALQDGDVLGALGDTVKDVRGDLMAGVLGIGEKAVDAGAYLAGGIGKLFGAEDFAEKTKDFISKDLYDEKAVADKILGVTSGLPDLVKTLKGEQLEYEEGSVFGDKTDALAQSGGQMLGTAALQMVGVPWQVTSGVTSFGSETENAFKQGATYGQAGLSGLISAGAEILTEKLFGGSGLGEKGLIDMDLLTKGISNKLAHALTKFGLDMTTEGMEEVFSAFASNLGSALYREENLLDILWSEDAVDNYIDSFVSGMAMGGFANLPKTAGDVKATLSEKSKNTATQQPQRKPSLVDDIVNRITANRKNTATEASQSTEKTSQDYVDSLLDEVTAKATGAPADSVGAAVEAFKATGTVTNKQATDILNSVKAVTQIINETGIKLPDTASGRRAAIKQAIADLVQKQTPPPVDTEVKTDYDNKNTQGGTVYADTYTQGKPDYSGGVRRNPQGNSQGEAAPGAGNGSVYAGNSSQSGASGAGNRGNVHTSDSEGRALTQDQAARLRETAVIDSNGAPLAVYHATSNMDFDTFEKGDTGFHFGSAAQAANRAKNRNFTSGRTFRAYLNIKNPVRANHDIMGWNPGGTALYLWGNGILTDAERQEIHSLYRRGDGYDSAAATRLREILEAKGYDGIVYPNDFEGEGDSYIAFRDEQIIRSEVTEFNSEKTAHPAPNESVGAAPSGFDVYSNLQYQYGNKPDREGTVRDINVPKKDASGRRVSDLAANIYGNKITSDPMVEVLEQLIADGAFGADVKSLNATQEAAIKRVQQNGRTRSTINVQNAMSKGQYSDDLFAEVAVLYADAQVRLEYQEAGELAAMLAEIARVGGRILNICKITKRLTPDGQLATRLSIAENVNLRANKPGRKKKVNVEISEQTKQDFKNVSTAAEAVVTDAASSLSQALKADTDAAANAAVAAGIKAGESAVRSAKRDGKSPATVETQETHIYDAIMEFVNSKTQKNITKASGQHSTKALDALQRYYSDRDQFQQAWSAAQRKAEAELSGNEKAYGVLRQFLDTGGMAQDVMDTQDGSSVSRKAVRQAAKASDVDLQSLVSSSLQDRATALQKIQDYVSSHYMMDESAANQLARQLQESFYQELSQRQTRRLFAMFGQKDTANAKAVEDQFRELYNAGAFTKDAFISREALKKLFGHDGLVLSDEVLEQYGQISDARKAAMDQRIIQEIADQIPSDLKSALKKWRYTAMLTNPSTHIKNMAGNLGQFIIQHGLKDNLAAVIEAGVDKVSGGKLGRTKAVLNPLSKADQALVAVAWNDYGTIMNNDGEVAKRIKNGGRYYEMRSAVEESRTVWKLNDAEGEGTDKRIKRGVNKVLSGLEAVSDFNSAAMDAEDAFFGRNSYAFALAGYMKANNLTEITEDARAYAIAQAQESTFHDDSLIYQKVKKAVGDGNVVFPFVKTPANVTSRAIEYSPGSLAKFGYDLVKMAAQNKQADLDAGVKKMTGAQAINDLSKGITGSALWGVGAWLAAQGLLRIVGTGDEDKREYEGLMGYKDFTVCIGGKYFEADFLSPAILPIYTGAAVYETFQNFTDGKATFSDVLDAIYSFADPVLSSSMMSSLEGYMYAIRSMGTLSIGELTGTLVGKTLETWLSQFFPSLIRRMAAAGDNVSRQTYADPDNPFSAFFQSIQSGIPGLRDDMKAKYDIWGQEIKQDAADGDDPMSWLWRVITPSRQSDVHTTGIDGEINRLLEAGYDAIPTSKNSKTITVDGKKLRLTQDQYETYEREEGRAAYALAKRIIESANYKLLSDAQKKAALQAAYGYADELGKEAALPGSYERNVPKYLQAFTGTGEDVTNAIIRHTATGSAEKFTDLPIDSASYISDLLDALKDAPREAKPDGSSYTDVRYVQRVEAITGSDLTEEQQKQIMDEVLDDAAYAKYLKILDRGYSNDDYAAALRIYLDSEKTSTRTKKEVIIREFMDDLDLTRKEAEALYKLYSGAK